MVAAMEWAPPMPRRRKAGMILLSASFGSSVGIDNSLIKIKDKNKKPAGWRVVCGIGQAQ
jgi:hypothetical protein